MSNKLTQEDVDKALAKAAKPEITAHDFDDYTFFEKVFLEEGGDADSYIVASIRDSNPTENNPFLNVSGNLTLGDCHRQISWYFETYVYNAKHLLGDKDAYVDRRVKDLLGIRVKRNKARKVREVLEKFLEQVDEDLARLEVQVKEDLTSRIGQVFEEEEEEEDQEASCCEKGEPFVEGTPEEFLEELSSD